MIKSLHGYEHLILGPSKTPRRALVYYTICRITKPGRVVETGVQSGLSSAFMLKAMEANSKGILYSIDLPDEKLLQAIPSQMRLEKKSGWVVPLELTKNWVLMIGKSEERLPPLLREISPIDIFIHDSDHSFENMYREFETAWPQLAPNGILLSDDVDQNNAFDVFASKIGVDSIRLTHTIGAIRKPR